MDSSGNDLCYFLKDTLNVPLCIKCYKKECNSRLYGFLCLTLVLAGVLAVIGYYFSVFQKEKTGKGIILFLPAAFVFLCLYGAFGGLLNSLFYRREIGERYVQQLCRKEIEKNYGVEDVVIQDGDIDTIKLGREPGQIVLFTTTGYKSLKKNN